MTIYKYKGWFLGVLPVHLECLEGEPAIRPVHWSLYVPMCLLHVGWVPVSFGLHLLFGTVRGGAPILWISRLEKLLVLEDDE